MTNKVLEQLQKLNRKWCYLKQEVLSDTQGRKNYISHIFYLDTKKEPEFIINVFNNNVEVIDNVVKKTKKEETILYSFVNSLNGGKNETKH